MNDAFDYTRPFKTKCGFPARLLGVLNRQNQPLAVAVSFDAGEALFEYNLEGTTDPGISPSDLSLVSTTHEEQDALKFSDFVHAVVTRELDPIPRDSNPYHYDHCSMGSNLIRGWHVMHVGYDSEDFPLPLRSLTLINTRSGQRLVVDLSTPKAVQPVFKRVYYGQAVGSDNEWVRFDEVPDERVLASLKDWSTDIGCNGGPLLELAEAYGFTDAAANGVSRTNGRLIEFKEFIKENQA